MLELQFAAIQGKQVEIKRFRISFQLIFYASFFFVLLFISKAMTRELVPVVVIIVIVPKSKQE